MSNEGPILQWRKLTGDASNKGVPWSCTPSLPNNACTSADQRTAIRHGKVKVSRQDCINAEARKRRVDAAKQRGALPRRRGGNDRKMHIVQSKRANYSHLVSSQRVMPKQDENRCPILYGSSKAEDRKEVAPLWLQPFTVIDEY